MERLMLDVAFAQPLKNWPLCALRFLQQGLIHETALLGLGSQIGSRAQIRLIGQHDKKFGLLSIGRVLNYPGRDLVRDVDRVTINTLRPSPRRSDCSNESHPSCNKEQ